MPVLPVRSLRACLPIHSDIYTSSAIRGLIIHTPPISPSWPLRAWLLLCMLESIFAFLDTAMICGYRRRF